MSEKRKRDHYIDNEKFFNEMKDWKKIVVAAEESGEMKPPITNYIGKCFLDIAEHLAMKPNFAPYPYRDEMICDAVENCVVYAANFDPEKSSNPFSYFTQIIYYAFLRRIQREKKQSFIKYKMVKDGIAEGSLGKSSNRMRGLEDQERGRINDFVTKKFDLSDKDIENFTKDVEKVDRRGKGKRQKRKAKETNGLFGDTDEDSSDI